jgi:uncharacterized protein with LGFP repeats
VTLADGTATNVTVETVNAPTAGAPSGSAGALSFVPVIDGPGRYVFAGALFGVAALLVAIALGWSPWRNHALRRAVVVVFVGGLVATACRPAPPATGAVPGQPAMIMRSQWGARPFGTGPVACSAPETTSKITFAVVHHTAGSNSYTPQQSAAIVRGIQSYHMDANGYCDIAYNFLVDKYGQIFEGRDGGITNAVIGGHAGGFNAWSTGVAVLGDFSSVKPSNEAWQGLVNLLRWRLSVGFVDPAAGTWHIVGNSPCNCQNWPPGTYVWLANAIVTHRDVDQTGCPGNAFYSELGTLRSQVQAGIVFPPTTTTSSTTATTLSGSAAAGASTTTTTAPAPTTTTSSSP